jgi:hypothetical protein
MQQAIHHNIFNVSYRKHGGLYFIRVGRLGFSFYLSRACREACEAAPLPALTELGGGHSRELVGVVGATLILATAFVAAMLPALAVLR